MAGGGCRLDSHPKAAEIANWLRQGLTSARINDKLHEMDSAEAILSSSTISYHRRVCLGLLRLEREQSIKLDKLPEPDMDEVEQNALKLFNYRLKNSPEKVKNSELVPVLTAIMRRKDSDDKKKNPLDEAMAGLGEEDEPNSQGEE